MRKKKKTKYEQIKLLYINIVPYYNEIEDKISIIKKMLQNYIKIYKNL